MTLRGGKGNRMGAGRCRGYPAKNNQVMRVDAAAKEGPAPRGSRNKSLSQRREGLRLGK